MNSRGRVSAVACLVGLVLLVNCSSAGKAGREDDEGGAAGAGGEMASGAAGSEQPGTDASDLNASYGQLGGRCDSDADCGDASSRCLAPAFFPLGAKYCTSTCNQPSDCNAFAATSYSIAVPLDPDGFGNNAWNSTELSRGVVCAPSSSTDGAHKYCQFACVENAAVSADHSHCACLPRYASVHDAQGQLTACEWDDASPCSLLSYPGRRNTCDACNSKPFVAGCYTGRYFCAVNRNFNGTCYDGDLNVGTLEGCLSAGTSDCDENCYTACAGSGGDTPGFATSNNCVNLCCKASTRPATQAPECEAGSPENMPTGGSGGQASGSAGASTAGASASDGGTSGEAGGSSSAGQTGSGGTSGVAGGSSSGGHTGSGGTSGVAGGSSSGGHTGSGGASGSGTAGHAP